MANIEDIPAEVRWEMATRSASSQSAAFDMMVRPIIGDKMDEIWDQIMAEGGKGSKAMAESLGLPTGNAIEVDDASSIIAEIIMGPEFKYEVIEADEDRVRGRFTGCPWLNALQRAGLRPTAGFPNPCQSYSQNSVESLNPKYTMRYDKRMCTGDQYCEYVIEPRSTPAAKARGLASG
jgi:hypothetical protein